ncbi:hypothetical protein JCM4814A_81710 [Streptomyces phaeofaciens JCM 4814]|uniref:Uncharacterized protein n=1 Tax=Streptomyces phaeofaciens TaxID=68254 RepID=A0A918M136_9ACTN|nr:hypothetical protein GCM10010226_79730 [Streptomyces phaeofaciens]
MKQPSADPVTHRWLLGPLLRFVTPCRSSRLRAATGTHLAGRARGPSKHDDRSVPYAAQIARVGYLGRSLQQARDFLGHGPGRLAELVKGRRDRP